MAAPTNAELVKKTLANPEPSTHGPSLHLAQYKRMSASLIGRFGGKQFGGMIGSSVFGIYLIPLLQIISEHLRD